MRPAPGSSRRTPLPPFDQAMQCDAHLLRRQMDPTAMAGQHPFEGMMRQLLDRTAQGLSIPYQLSRRFQPLALRLPPEVIAGEQKSIPIEQTAAAGRMAGHRDDAELLAERSDLRPLDDLFGIRHGMGVFAMDDPFRAEMTRVLGCVRDIVFMRQKNIGEAAHPLEGLDQVLEITR